MHHAIDAHHAHLILPQLLTLIGLLVALRLAARRLFPPRTYESGTRHLLKEELGQLVLLIRTRLKKRPSA